MELKALSENRSWLYSAGIALLVVAWLVSGQFGNETPAIQNEASARTETPGQPQKVRVRTQASEEVVRTITVNGETAPARLVELSAETDGRVTAIGVKRGSNAQRGSMIVRLDERDRRARLAEAEAIVKQREVEFAARAQLKNENYVSEAQLQEGVALLEAARTELMRAKLDLDYMFVRAPFDGALQARHVEVGDFVKRGDPIATFVDNRRLVVSADVSEFDARFVKVGESAEARLATGQRVRGTIRYVAPVADEGTRTFAVELEVDNANGSLRAGGTAELFIPAERILAHRVSPALLSLDDAGNIGVKIVNENGKVQFVPADIALSSNDGVWLAGLPKTATIITVGQGFVAAGSFVEAIPESDPDTALAIKLNNQED